MDEKLKQEDFHMITNFRDWKMFSQEYYVYEIDSHRR